MEFRRSIPADATGMKILRKNPASKTHDWNKWNETSDLTIPTNGNNCYKITSWSGGSWTSFTPTATNAVLTVAGSAGLCGTNWDTNNTANDMVKKAEGLYEKVYTNVAAGTYEFKVVLNHSWGKSWGNGTANYKLSVTEAGSKVTILFDAVQQTISTEVVKEYAVTFNGTNVTSDGADTAVKGRKTWGW
mgnify:CR=1 FL=1